MESIQTIIAQETPEWYYNAQCIGTSSEIFFPDGRGESVKYAKMISLAKSICGECTVRRQCLEYAMDSNQPDGVWGGKTLRERKRLRVRG
jgi:WhiB family transcriptional regulator, redox-sensing transcriptional regulator